MAEKSSCQRWPPNLGHSSFKPALAAIPRNADLKTKYDWFIPAVKVTKSLLRVPFTWARPEFSFDPMTVPAVRCDLSISAPECISVVRVNTIKGTALTREKAISAFDRGDALVLLGSISMKAFGRDDVGQTNLHYTFRYCQPLVQKGKWSAMSSTHISSARAMVQLLTSRRLGLFDWSKRTHHKRWLIAPKADAWLVYCWYRTWRARELSRRVKKTEDRPVRYFDRQTSMRQAVTLYQLQCHFKPAGRGACED